MTTQHSDFASNRSQQGSPLKPKASSVASISEWESKMENIESHRQMDLLNNRIHLLQIEQQKRQKRIESVQRKSQYRQDVRQNHEVFVHLKEHHKQQAQEEVIKLNRKTREIKNKSVEEKAHIKSQIQNIKRAEYERIKQQSEQNQKLIENQKKESYHYNSTKRQHVKKEEYQGQVNVAYHRQKKFLEFSMEHERNKIRHLREKQQNLIKLQKLEQEEMLWLQRIQESTNQQKLVEQNAFRIHKRSPMSTQKISPSLKKPSLPDFHSEGGEERVESVEKSETDRVMSNSNQIGDFNRSDSDKQGIVY